MQGFSRLAPRTQQTGANNPADLRQNTADRRRESAIESVRWSRHARFQQTRAKNAADRRQKACRTALGNSQAGAGNRPHRAYGGAGLNGSDSRLRQVTGPAQAGYGMAIR